MKKIYLIATVSLLAFSCGTKEDKNNIDTLIASKNINALKERRTLLQEDLNKLNEALASLEVTKNEALVSVSALKDTIFNHYIEIQGNVNTKENMLIQPEFSGTLTELNVKAGDHVNKGQILGRIDDAVLSQQLSNAENQYSLAKTTYERQKNLWDKKIGSEIQFLQTQTQMVTAQKAIAQIKAQLNKTIIKAPFTGTIDEVFVEKGQVIAPSAQGLMRIVNLNNMYVSTTVSENYIGKLQIGDRVDIFISSLGESYKGKIRQIGNFINPNNRTFSIEVAVPNPDKLLRPNQVVKLKITDYTNTKALVVPTNVIQKDSDGNNFVFSVANNNGKTGIAKKTIIQIGMSSDNYTEIISGLSSNDTIVIEGVNSISDGMKLNL